jgi:hypothetical protein
MGNILVDSGFKSFEYDDARRYVISKQAHNTLSFESSDYMNKDNIIAYMDRTSPYGSSITGAEIADGLVVMHGVDALLARQNILHARSAVLDPGKWLLIIDFVKNWNGISILTNAGTASKTAGRCSLSTEMGPQTSLWPDSQTSLSPQRRRYIEGAKSRFVAGPFSLLPPYVTCPMLKAAMH